MPRVRAVELDGLSFPISPLTFDEVDVHIAEAKALVEKEPKPTQQDYAMRTLTVVAQALNKGAKASGTNVEWTPKKVAAELDMVMINKIYQDFISMSGLAPVTTGEAAATLTSR